MSQHRENLWWMTSAVCRETDPEIFFPEKGGSAAEAKTICGNCPFEATCLKYALDRNEEFGVWGGLTRRERRVMQAAKPAPDKAAHAA